MATKHSVSSFVGVLRCARCSSKNGDKVKKRKASREKLNTIPSQGKLVIAIDIDGTIADSRRVDFENANKSPQEVMKAKPIAEARQAIRKLYKMGHKIVFHSSRLECQRKPTVLWLKKHGFPYHFLELRKFAANLYIDDRAINGRYWKRIVKEMKDPTLLRHARKRKCDRVSFNDSSKTTKR